MDYTDIENKDATPYPTPDATPDAVPDAVPDADDELAAALKAKRKAARKRKLITLYAVMGVAIVAVIVFGTLLGIELYTSWQSNNYYATMSAGMGNAASRTLSEDRIAQLISPAKPPETTGTQPDSAAPDAEPGTGEQEDDEEFIYIGRAWTPYADFAALGEGYPGITAWILSEGTPINYPIMHGTDNDFFLSHLPDGKKQKAGSIFLDYRNKPDYSDKSIVIYGHYMRTREMFGSFGGYREQSYYEDHPVMYIFTPERDFAVMLFSAYLLDSAVEVPPMTFKDDDAFLKHVENIKKRSFFKTGVEISPGDQIVSMASCAYDFANARIILVGKLVEIGSAAAIQ